MQIMLMTYKSLLLSTAILIISAGGAALAAEEPLVDEAGDDGGLMDQTVPVAEDAAAQPGPPRGRKPDLRKELMAHVRSEIGPIASPDKIQFAPGLPKTRSGKIMRRVLASLVAGRDPGDVSTLANPEIVEELRKMVK